MRSKTGRVTRFDAVLFETAAAEGARQSRSARQQLEHWARLGAALCAQVDSPVNRVRRALEGAVAHRDLPLDEARQFDPAVAVQIDDAVAQADFTCAPLPDFTAVSPDPNRVLADMADMADMASRARAGGQADVQLRDALFHLEQVLEEHQRAEPGR